MNDRQADLVTVFRSLDVDAHSEADRVRLLLAESGLEPVLLDDKAPGVVEGTYEVRVPAEQSARAEELIAAEGGVEELEPVDPSADLDMAPVFHSEGSAPTAEMEATEIQSLLVANGIDAMVVGTSTMPNLPFEVRVPKADVERARSIIDEAVAAGPAAAEEAAALTEPVQSEDSAG